MNLSKLFKYSKFNFYIQNTLWNFKFWLHCKKIYKTFTFEIKLNDFIMDEGFKMHYKKKMVTKKRFSGYLYKNQIYYDNPGLKINDRNLWEHWKNKGLIN